MVNPNDIDIEKLEDTPAARQLKAAIAQMKQETGAKPRRTGGKKAPPGQIYSEDLAKLSPSARKQIEDAMAATAAAEIVPETAREETKGKPVKPFTAKDKESKKNRSDNFTEQKQIATARIVSDNLGKMNKLLISFMDENQQTLEWLEKIEKQLSILVENSRVSNENIGGYDTTPLGRNNNPAPGPANAPRISAPGPAASPSGIGRNAIIGGAIAGSVAASIVAMPNEAVGQAIHEASRRVGVDEGAMLAFARQESSFNPNARAPVGTAQGLYQFIEPTWNAMVRRYSAEYPELLRGRNDPLANSIAGALYMRENAEGLRRQNIEVNATTLYATHFLGPTGGAALLRADPTASAATILPSAAANNPGIFYRNGRQRTVAEVREHLDLIGNRRAAGFTQELERRRSGNQTVPAQIPTAQRISALPASMITPSQIQTPQQHAMASYYGPAPITHGRDLREFSARQQIDMRMASPRIVQDQTVNMASIDYTPAHFSMDNVIDPNNPGPVEPADAAERYQRMFSMGLFPTPA